AHPKGQARHQSTEKVQQTVAVLAPTQRHHHPIAVRQELVLLAGPLHLAIKLAFVVALDGALIGGGTLVGGEPISMGPRPARAICSRNDFVVGRGWGRGPLGWPECWGRHGGKASESGRGELLDEEGRGAGPPTQLGTAETRP